MRRPASPTVALLARPPGRRLVVSVLIVLGLHAVVLQLVQPPERPRNAVPPSAVQTLPPAAGPATVARPPSEIRPRPPAMEKAPANEPVAVHSAAASTMKPVEVTAQAQAPHAADPLPTQLAASYVVELQAQRGTQHSPATLRWTHEGQRYELTLTTDGWLTMHSEGGFDPWGLAPTRFTEQRRPRSARALTMERAALDGTGRVAYSARSAPGPLSPGLQDRLSWLVQVQARVAARVPMPGDALTVQVASPAGDQQEWRLQRLPPEDAEDRLIKLRHVPLKPYDNGVELWLEESPPHALRWLKLSAAQGEPLVLTRVDRAESTSTSSPEAPK